MDITQTNKINNFINFGNRKWNEPINFLKKKNVSPTCLYFFQNFECTGRPISTTLVTYNIELIYNILRAEIVHNPKKFSQLGENSH